MHEGDTGSSVMNTFLTYFAKSTASSPCLVVAYKKLIGA